MNVLYFFTLFVVILLECFNHTVGGDPKFYDGLIYSVELKKLDQMDQADTKKKCLSCLIACPAATQQESTFDVFDSLTTRSLFLRKFNKNTKFVTNMELKICEKPFIPAMVYDSGKQSYDVGYELYYDLGVTKLSNRDYMKLRKIHFNQVIGAEPAFSGLVKRSIDKSSTTIFEIDESKRTLVFAWLPVISIQFHDHQRYVRFQPDEVNEYKTIDKCENYITGDEWVKKQVDKLVEKSSPPKLTKENLESSCKLQENCLEKIQIMPMRFLHTYAAKMATCTHLNIALIWERVARGQLEVVDRYLYAVFRLWYSSINIIFGVSGEYTLEKDEIRVQESEEIKPTGTEETLKKIPIPNLMYRIVEYFANSRNYRVLIVIHNNREIISNADRICSVDDEVEGWDRIKSKDVEFGVSYACEVSDETIGKLGKYGATNSDIVGVFKLNRFPEIRLFGGGSINFKDETQRVNEMYDKIFPEPPSKL